VFWNTRGSGKGQKGNKNILGSDWQIAAIRPQNCCFCCFAGSKKKQQAIFPKEAKRPMGRLLRYSKLVFQIAVNVLQV